MSSSNGRIVVPLPPEGVFHLAEYETYLKQTVQLKDLCSVVLMTTFFMDKVDADQVLSDVTSLWMQRFPHIYPGITKQEILKAQEVLETVLDRIKAYYLEHSFLSTYLRDMARICLTFTPEIVFGDTESLSLRLGEDDRALSTQPVLPHYNFTTIRPYVRTKDGP